MTKLTKPPFRADHVGSFLRPKSITDGFKKLRTGEINAEVFRAIQDNAIRDIIKLQEDVGLASITDGEFRRNSYWHTFVDRVEGLEVKDALFSFHDDHGHEQSFTAPHVGGKVKRTRSIAGDEFDFLSKMTTQTPKITLPSPPSMHLWRKHQGVNRSVYPTDQMFFDDLSAVFRQEIAALAEDGCTYIQLDDVPLAMLCDENVRAQLVEVEMNPNQLMDEYIQLFNDCLRERPKDVIVAIHLCRGNYKGHFISEGGYENVADKMFNEIDADAFFLEYDSARAGDFAPLRHVPKEKMVIIGIVSSKSPELETVDELCDRIDQATKFIDLNNLGLSPQCGFASTVAGNPVTFEDQKAKLARIVEVAEKVWG